MFGRLKKNPIRIIRRPTLQRYCGTFVSKHFYVDPKDVRQVLEEMPSRYRRADGHYEVQVCNFCDKGNKQKEGNLWKLYVNDDGSYRCFRCSKGGSWFDLKRKVANGVYHDTNIETIDFKDSSKTSEKPTIIDAKVISSMPTRLFGEEEGAQTVLKYLTETRGLNKLTLQRYGVGFAVEKFRDDSDVYVDHLCISFPWMEERPVSNSGGHNKEEEKDVMGDEHVRQMSELALSAAAEEAEGVESGEKESSEDSGSVQGSLRDESGNEVAEVRPVRAKFDAVRVKYRAINGKGKQRLYPKGGPWGFFGWHTVRPTDNELIITEGEFDTMAVSQVLSKLKKDHKLYKIPVISLPNGASSLPPNLLPRLERFKKIYLWMDNDGAGSIAAEKFSRKLGLRRCVVVKPLPDDDDENPPKDANDALRHPSNKGKQMIVDMLTAASVIKHDRLSSFKDLRTAVLNYIMYRDGTALGTPTPSIPKLSSITKGFREGELVVFTGPTGAGKTTLLSQLTLDFAKEGAPTLWGSFEIQNVKLLEKMLQQTCKEGRVALLPPDKLHKLADRFESLPMLFMNFHGGSELAEILDAMEYAVYQHDIKHIVLDNLQFMMPRSSRGGFDKFEAQDHVIESFRKFATEKLVNVILVIHPRKEDDRMPLHMASIFGTAKATQEADIVMILQRVEGETSVDVRKNRFDGTLGSVSVQFNSATSTFYETEK